MRNKKFLTLTLLITLSVVVFSGCGIKFNIEPPHMRSSVHLDKYSDSFQHDFGKLDTSFLNNFIPNMDMDMNMGDFSDFFSDIDGLPDEGSVNNINSYGYYEENLTDSLPSSNISSIRLGVYASKLIIKSVDGDNFTISCTGKSKFITGTTFVESNGVLVVRENKVPSFNYSFSKTDSFRSVVLGVPASYKGDIKMFCGAGTVDINNSNFNDINISGGAGAITINDITFNNMEIMQGVGDISMTLSSPCGNMSIKGGMGTFNADLKAVGGNLDYDGGVGDATITLPDNAPVKIDCTSGIGKTSISAKTSPESKYIFDINMGIGSLTVK